MAAGRFQEVQRADGVDLEVVEGSRRRQIMTGLRGRMHDEAGMKGAHQGVNSRSIANIQVVVLKIGMGGQQAAGVAAGIAFGAEEVGAHVVVDAMHGPAEAAEVVHHFGADQPGGAGDEEGGHVNREESGVRGKAYR